MDDHERELADATAELSETLEALREELSGRSEGPLGVPRPPKPSELLRFTEQYTIPTTIAVLEAAIRSLELLAAVLRVAEGHPIDAASGHTRSRLTASGRERITESSRETLRRLDDALAELQSAARGDSPTPEVQRLLEEARKLRTEVDDRLAEATESSTPDRPNMEAPSDGDRRAFDEEIEIDVDEELASIKSSVRENEDDETDTREDPDDPS